MYTSHIHGRDPGKLSNSPKWPKSSPYVPSPAKTKGVGWGAVMGG